ncbi:MAG: endonuclease III domain-containing protein [Candidatus Hydrogenedentota bacterium]
MATPRSLRHILGRYYGLLANRFGRTGWWPADTPFEIVVGAILTQNTAWENVGKAIANLKSAHLLSPRAILAADTAALHEALRPSGYFRVKTKRLRSFCEYLVARHGGSMKRMARVPLETLRTQLLSVHGIGHETADDILLYVCGKPVFVVDAYTRRIFSRHGLVPKNSAYTPLREFFENALVPDVDAFKEYHALIVYTGKEYCRTKPRCDQCPLRATLKPGQPLL